jgi:hypothetical protein
VALDLRLCCAVLFALCSLSAAQVNAPPSPGMLHQPAAAGLSRLPALTGDTRAVAQDPLAPEYVAPPVGFYTGAAPGPPVAPAAEEEWTWQVLPSGLIYRSYLAGVKEPRIASTWSFDSAGDQFWDTTLGGRAAILRHGTTDPLRPDGWELDIEGAAIVRLDPQELSTPVIGTDFRFGFPLTYGNGPWRYKLGYYHLSAHAGDEFLLANPDFVRINYVRETLLWGLGYYWTPDLRIYGEAGYAVSATGGAEPFELQFGMDYSPALPTTLRPAPFAAVNCHLREEVGFGGNVVLQAGWQWRGANGGHLFRTGMEYYNGKSPQFEFFDESEQRLGVGLWYDF